MGNHCPSCQGKTGSDYVNCLHSSHFYVNAGDGAQQAVAEYNYFLDGAPERNWGVDVGKQMWKIQSECNTTAYDPTLQLICESGVENAPSCPIANSYLIDPTQPEKGYDCYYQTAGKVHADQYNTYAYWFYKTCHRRIELLCGPENFDEIWPFFYKFTTSTKGKESVEALIGKHLDSGKPLSPECVAALRNNYTDEVQTLYGLLNENDWDTVPWGWTYNPADRSCDGPYSWIPPSQLIPPQGLVGGITIGNTNPTYYQQWDPNDSTAWMSFFRKKTLAATDWSKGFLGNPLWNRAQKLGAMQSIFDQGTPGIDETNFLDEWAKAYLEEGLIPVTPGESATDYLYPKQHAGEISWITDPEYTGNLPRLAQYAVGNEPWHIVTTDPKSYGYHDPCLDKPILDEILPFAIGGIAGGMGATFFPGDTAKVVAAGTLGASGYYLTQGTLGWSAVVNWNDIDADKKRRASVIFSVGMPIAIVESLASTDILKITQNERAAAVAAAAAGGYFLLLPIVDPILQVGGTVTRYLQAPFAFIEAGLTWLFDGCAAHTVFTNVTCLCEEANQKPLLAQALVRDIYGTTGKQQEMRMTCMREAMTSNSWGSDPIAIGTCDSKGHMSDPTDCLSAGEWAYNRWPSSIAGQAQPKWDQIKHCVEETNPSFLPPRDIDKACLEYGPRFRFDGATNQCRDFSKPPGLQGVPA